MELLLYIFEDSLSKDIAHINSTYNSISEKNIIIIGNSLTREGVDQAIVNNHVSKLSLKDIEIGCLYPDDTSIIEWYYIVKSIINNKESLPVKVIINFASDQLVTDKFEFEEIQRISNWIPLDQLYSVAMDEQFTFSEIFHLYMSKWFRIYRYKERVSKRILDILPYYRSTMRTLNKTIQQNDSHHITPQSYKHLKQLIELAESNNIQLLFCTMPLPNKYVLSEKVISIISESKLCQLIDLHNTDKYSTSHFKDGYHLNKIGATKFTKQYINIIH